MTTKFVIHHSPILKGEVKIQGAKNAAQNYSSDYCVSW